VTSESTRRVVSTPRCTGDSGTKGRLYERKAIPASPSASSAMSHHGIGDAKWIRVVSSSRAP
jgi:hypothetical protein